jgi:hypothetical protein
MIAIGERRCVASCSCVVAQILEQRVTILLFLSIGFLWIRRLLATTTTATQLRVTLKNIQALHNDLLL